MTALALAAGAGLLIGVSLGALGGGGSVLAVPVLVHLLGQSPAQATTGSLVVVATASLVGALGALRAGRLLLGRGVGFGLVAVGGAAVGARASSGVPGEVLLAAFAVLMLVVAGVMIRRLVRRRPTASPESPGSPTTPSGHTVPAFDDPIVTFSPTFACQCPRALKVAVAATAVGLLTGFLGVGGGFLVVPALVMALAVPMEYAAGTSLVVITVTSLAALAVRAGEPTSQPSWTPVLVLTLVSALAALAGPPLARRLGEVRLQAAFAALVLGVAALTAASAVPALI